MTLEAFTTAAAGCTAQLVGIAQRLVAVASPNPPGDVAACAREAAAILAEMAPTARVTLHETAPGVVNLVAVASYATAALAYTAFLYALYLGLALAGWREWRRAMPGGPSGA